MALISQDEINKIRTNVNIIDIISEYIPLTQKGKNYFCVCPFHDDHSPSMSVSLDKQIYKCFSCGASGNVFTFVQNYENVSFVEAVTIVAKSAGITLSKSFEIKPDDKYKDLYEIMELSNKFFQNNIKTSFGMAAKEYLANRGISEEIINEFGIGLATDEKTTLTTLLKSKNFSEKTLVDLGVANSSDNKIIDAFTRRIIFPICNIKGKVIAFTARAYKGDDNGIKYINSKETTIFKKGHVLYNYHNASIYAKQEKKMIVVEGNMDAIRLSASGFKNVVALMGTSLTKEQIVLLKKLKVDILLCLDNDNAGINAMNTNGEMLSKEGCNVFILKISDAKDPDEYILKYGTEKFKQFIATPVRFFDYRLSFLKQNKNLDNADDLAKYINEVIRYLSGINDAILREITLNKLSEEYNISSEVLKNKLNILDKTEEKKEIQQTEHIVIKNKRKNKYETAAEKIIYFMLNDADYIKMYQRQLGYFEEAIIRNIANEIIYFYKVNGEINIADFISFVHNKKDINDKVLEIINNSNEEEINGAVFEEYVEVIKKELILNEIKDIKRQLKEELDVNKKIEFLKRLTEIKKEV